MTTADFSINSVELDRPWTWLAAGWRDFTRAPLVSILYGGIFTLAGYVLTYALYAVDMLPVALPLAAGFMLVGPVAAVGLYDVSRRLEQGRPATLGDAVWSFFANFESVSALGLILMLFLLAWIRLATLIFAVFYGDQPMQLQQFVGTVFFAPESLPFVVTGTVIGAVLAAVVFTISVIALPMLLDRDVGTMAAIAASVAAVNSNRQAMLLWAALIVIFTGVGVATLFVGLVVCLPLIGYASWHAYRDLITSSGNANDAA